MLVGFPQQVPLFQAVMSASCWQRAVHQRKMVLSSLFLHSIHQQLDHKICQSTSVCVYKYTNVAAHWLVLQQIKDLGLLKLSMALSWRMLWEDWYSFEVFRYAWVMADELLRRASHLVWSLVVFWHVRKKTLPLFLPVSFHSLRKREVNGYAACLSNMAQGLRPSVPNIQQLIGMWSSSKVRNSKVNA